MAKRVVVAMSGGVDSSVAAALCVEQGYDVVGIMMRLWSEDGDGAKGYNRCCTPDQMADARYIADKLGIPFYVLDTRDVFKGTIVQFFVEQYSRGVTPNPCLECNRHIRFEWLLNNALALDADYLATGHYARIRQAADGKFQLLKGLDDAKDQSYVLSVMGQPQLSRTLFPVGEYAKPQVRDLAARFGLPVASKGDSQDLCFLADGDYRGFLRRHSPQMTGAQISAPGPIRRDGRVLGQHRPVGLPSAARDSACGPGTALRAGHEHRAP
jgi:tRNA-specific 2-thiouridylase